MGTGPADWRWKQVQISLPSQENQREGETLLLLERLLKETQQVVNPLVPASLSACRFSFRYPHKINCPVMRTKQLIITVTYLRFKTKFSQPFKNKTIETV